MSDPMLYVADETGYALKDAADPPTTLRGRLFMIIALVAAVLLAMGAPGWFLYLGLMASCFFYLAVVDCLSAVCLFLLLSPFYLVIRNAAPFSVVLSGARSIWLFVMVLGWLLSVARGDCRFPKGSDITVLLMFMGLGLVMSVVTGSLFEGFLGFRAMIAPAFIYPIARSLILKRPHMGRVILRYVVIACFMLAILQFFWYKGMLDVHIVKHEGIVTGGGGRTIFGIHFERMTSLVGGGASNLAIYCGAGMLIGATMALQKDQHLLARIILIATAIVTGIACFLALSRSMVLLLMAAILFYMFTPGAFKMGKMYCVVVGVLLLVTTVFGTVFHGETLIKTIKDDLFAWTIALPKGASAILGKGITVPGGTILREVAWHPYADAGWVAIWAKMGIAGLLLILTWLGLVVCAYFRLARSRTAMLPHRYWVAGVIAGVIALALAVGSAHTTVIMRNSTCTVFFVLAGTMVTLSRINSGLEEDSWGPQESLDSELYSPDDETEVQDVL